MPLWQFERSATLMSSRCNDDYYEEATTIAPTHQSKMGRQAPMPGRDQPTRVRVTCIHCWARIGGGRSFQQRVAANLKEPRNATVRCLGVEKMWVHARFEYFL
ncbi:uncharacterized protein LOC114362529 [Ostrinia furnacalis]|uniref:uncharacterized protein LOC114362529 n=1 Tax=Ostrinia furnacalis TaxID=93504 RepID=UPI001039C64A|nr:uncharacterized protein LOC114362529 [Ostrinia furnacalis]